MSNDPTHVTLTLDGPGELRQVVVRPLASADDYARGEALQEATWGEGFAEKASATMMMIAQKVGGIAAGAFTDDDWPQGSAGELVGFVFGMTGLKGGRPVHWSHMLAVDQRLRGRGLGRRLKAYQRRRLLEIGVDTMLWTYDPLEARNAHLNLERLGAEPVEYIENLYGDGGRNALHRGLGTDRFVVEWRLASPEVEQTLGREPAKEDDAADAPRLNLAADGRPRGDAYPLPDAPRVRVAVPADIQRRKQEAPEEAVLWRTSTRRAFLHYLGRGYRVRRLLRGEGLSDYLLEAPTGG